MNVRTLLFCFLVPVFSVACGQVSSNRSFAIEDGSPKGYSPDVPSKVSSKGYHSSNCSSGTCFTTPSSSDDGSSCANGSCSIAKPQDSDNSISAGCGCSAGGCQLVSTGDSSGSSCASGGCENIDLGPKDSNFSRDSHDPVKLYFNGYHASIETHQDALDEFATLKPGHGQGLIPVATFGGYAGYGGCQDNPNSRKVTYFGATSYVPEGDVENFELEESISLYHVAIIKLEVSEERYFEALREVYYNSLNNPKKVFLEKFPEYFK